MTLTLTTYRPLSTREKSIIRREVYRQYFDWLHEHWGETTYMQETRWRPCQSKIDDKLLKHNDCDYIRQVGGSAVNSYVFDILDDVKRQVEQEIADRQDLKRTNRDLSHPSNFI